MAEEFMITNGIVIDPGSQLYGAYHILVRAGKIVEISSGSAGEYPGKIIDAAGCIITPGLIDLHTHVFPGQAIIGIAADQIGVKQGVSVVVDAGSAGTANFAAFVRDVVTPSKTRVFSWLNIASAGLCAGRSELKEIDNIDTAYTAEFIKKNPLIRGIKVRMSRSVLGASGLKPLEKAKQVAKAVKLPVMVHIGNGPPALGDILDLLENGDIVTHAFHGKNGGIFDDKIGLIPQAQKALARGVLFDVGHGTESFSFNTLQKAKRAGVHPYTISTDLYGQNYHGPVYSLATTMSKVLALGYSLQEVIAAVTKAPAKVLGLEASLGALAVGRNADISILQLFDEECLFIDSENQQLVGRQLLRPKFTIQSGEVLKCI